MKDVQIVEAFTGYPDGKTETHYRPDPEPISVPNDFADMIVEKGYARWPKTEAKAEKPAKAAAEGETK